MQRILVPSCLLVAACAVPPPAGMLRARLCTQDAALGFAAVASAFAARNPGYTVQWLPATTELAAEAAPRIALLQAGAASAVVRKAAGDARTSDVGVGDVLVLPPCGDARFDGPVDLLVFTMPDVPAATVPPVIRPDQDPRITDTPGGCATDGKAYRRVLLTWLDANGPYTFHGLNVHRVRIDDSFTHYHPLVGGFDEFYLVQAARPGACILTSERTADILNPDAVAAADVPHLLQRTELAAGDLVYLPRGTAHRGLGGVLAQVITVPGFRPGAEIGLDFHLRRINERLGLRGEAALPLHAAASERQVVR